VSLALPLSTDPDTNPDGSPVAITRDRRGEYVPVIMVHGWTGTSTHDSRSGAFSKRIDLSTNQVGTIEPSRSLIGQLQRVPGAAVFTFDYHDHSASWVTDEHLGPALGEAIDCLYRATGEKVIVVAHSMGGLVTREALAGKGTGDVDRVDEVSTVITFGTPETGSLIAMLAANALDVSSLVNSQMAVLRTMLAHCGGQASRKLETGGLCDLLPAEARAADSEAGRALRYGSPQLATLPPFPKKVAVDALAGDIVLTVPKIGWFALPWETENVPIGDGVVTADSAVHNATTSTKASCSYQMSPVRGAADALGLQFRVVATNDAARNPLEFRAVPCFHGNLMRTIQLTNEATGMVDEDIAGRRRTEVVTVVPVDHAVNPKPDYEVRQGGGAIDCGASRSYPSAAAVGDGIVSCSPVAAAADVCWAGPDRVTLLCGIDPREKVLYRYTAQAPVSPVVAEANPTPWALDLDDGSRCRLRNGGSWSGRSDDLVGAYYCDPGTAVVLVRQEGNVAAVDRSKPMWTVLVGELDDSTASPPPVTKEVVRAYFAGSPS